MTSAYAIFFQLPFEKRGLCIYENREGIHIEEGLRLNSTDKIICLNFDDYLQGVTKADCIPSDLFDLNVAIRILCGFPASQFTGNSAPWIGISCLGKHLGKTNLFPALRAIEIGKVGNYSDWARGLPEGWEALLIAALKREYQRVVTELKSTGLLEQFLEVEMPLKCEFAKVGVQGITIDPGKLEFKYQDIDREYFKAVKTLELKYGFRVNQHDRDISYDTIKKFVEGYAPRDFSRKYFWESIELMQESSEFLRSLLIEHRNRWDLAELLRISSSISDNCKTSYDIFGTVSARILLIRPGIQYLKRASRDIFTPRAGYDFLYADYAQFEPGILASFSGDTKLIDLYNRGDIYRGLAAEIANGCSRKMAKEIFLSFIYGMSKENIRYRITRNFGEGAGKAADSFFTQFGLVEKWKQRTIKEAMLLNFAKGPFSYIRRVSSEDTEGDIERWAPNHVVQSTASGIFKSALCGIRDQLKVCRMLVPMHDAILLECPTSLAGEVKGSVEKIMIHCFEESCPGVKAKISFAPFYTED